MRLVDLRRRYPRESRLEDDLCVKVGVGRPVSLEPALETLSHAGLGHARQRTQVACELRVPRHYTEKHAARHQHADVQRRCDTPEWMGDELELQLVFARRKQSAH